MDNAVAINKNTVNAIISLSRSKGLYFIIFEETRSSNYKIVTMTGVVCAFEKRTELRQETAQP